MIQLLTMSFKPICIVVGAMVLSSPLSFAFDLPIDQKDGFTAEIFVPMKVEVSGDPARATLEIRNETDLIGKGTVDLSGIDGWKVSPEPKFSNSNRPNSDDGFAIKPGETLVLPFSIHPATDSVSALYPIHAYADIQAGTGRPTLHAIAIVEVEGFSRPPVVEIGIDSHGCFSRDPISFGSGRCSHFRNPSRR